jgi:hypothetical protein
MKLREESTKEIYRMEGPRPNHIKLQTGLRLYSIPRSNSEKPFFFHWGSHDASIVICGICLKTHDIAGAAVREVVR